MVHRDTRQPVEHPGHRRAGRPARAQWSVPRAAAPNYVAVVIEGLALPLVHSAWVTAAAFTVANAFLLTARIRVEDAALRELAAQP